MGKSTKGLTIHILLYGEALCGQQGLPKDWPEKHYWTHPSEPDLATCKVCKKVFKTFEDGVSDGDTPVAAVERFVHRKKETKPDKPFKVVFENPDAEPEDENAWFTPEDEEQHAYVEWATRIASTFHVKVYITKLAKADLLGRSDSKYALQMKDDPYRSRLMVDPKGKIWDCEVLT